MKRRYRLVCLSHRSGMFYSFDTHTRRRESLETKDRHEAQRLLDAKNDSHRQPALNLNIARAYLAGADSGFTTRNWNDVFKSLIETKHGETKERWLRAEKEKAFDSIRNKILTETRSEHLFEVLKRGTVSTNVHLRKLHNFAVGVGWLPWPIVPKRQWPEIRFKDKRAITVDEHQKIIGNECNPERKAFYELCWHLGAAQSDIALLTADDIDWRNKTIGFSRKKTKAPVIIHFSDDVSKVLHTRPKETFLFPAFSKLRSAHRATEFKRACKRLGIAEVTLHCYRYAWAERAKEAGYPERFAMQALGHNSKAVHRSYSKKALVKLPSLEEYEKKIIPLPQAVNQ